MVWHQSNVSPRPPWPSGPGAESNQQTLGNGAYLRVTRGYDASPLRSEATQTRLKRTTPIMNLKSIRWPRPIPRRFVAACAALLLSTACLVRAQDTNAAAGTNAMDMATNAPATTTPASTANN